MSAPNLPSAISLPGSESSPKLSPRMHVDVEEVLTALNLPPATAPPSVGVSGDRADAHDSTHTGIHAGTHASTHAGTHVGTHRGPDPPFALHAPHTARDPNNRSRAARGICPPSGLSAPSAEPAHKDGLLELIKTLQHQKMPLPFEISAFDGKNATAWLERFEFLHEEHGYNTDYHLCSQLTQFCTLNVADDITSFASHKKGCWADLKADILAWYYGADKRQTKYTLSNLETVLKNCPPEDSDLRAFICLYHDISTRLIADGKITHYVAVTKLVRALPKALSTHVQRKAGISIGRPADMSVDNVCKFLRKYDLEVRERRTKLRFNINFKRAESSILGAQARPDPPRVTQPSFVRTTPASTR